MTVSTQLNSHSDSDHPVIAFTGPFGSGLTTAAQRLGEKYGYHHVNISGQLRKEWFNRYGDQEPVRSDLQHLGDEIRQREGPATLVNRALQDTGFNLSDPIAIESIKNVGEIYALRRRFGYRLLIVAVLSDFEQRTKRVLSTYEELGLDENHLLEDDQRDRNEEVAYGQQVELCIDLADIILLNNTGLSELNFITKIDDLFGLVSRTKPRALHQTEIYMHAAYSMARSSKCIKRHVGAVLVDGRGQLVAAGFNENPTGTKPCIEEDRYQGRCHRDIVRNRHFLQLARKGSRCPVCDAPLTDSPGPPWRCQACYSEGRRTDLEAFYFPDRAMNWCTAVHAEVRAILAAGDKARGSTLYTTTFPCMQCAEQLTQADISKVVYTEAYPDPYGSDRLNLAQIPVLQFEGVRSSAVERLFPNPWQPTPWWREEESSGPSNH